MQYTSKMTNNSYPIYVGRQAFSEIAKNLIGSAIFVIIGAIFLSLMLNVYAIFVILPFLVLFVFLLLGSLVFNLLYLSAISYSVTNSDFNLKGGIIARFEKVLPYSRIQHVIITRTFMQRVMGLSTVVIQTASPDVVYRSNRDNQDPFAGNPRIPGLDVKDAEKLKDYIIAQVLRSKSGQGIQ